VIATLFAEGSQGVQELGEDITPFLAGRGTIRFPADQPIPDDVVTRVVGTRVTELRSGGGR